MPSDTAAKNNGNAPGQGSGRDADSPFKMPAKGWKEVLLRTWKESSKDNVSVIAAGVAFYGFLALVPLLGAIVLTYGLVADPQTVVRHAGELTAVLPAQVAQLVGEQLLNVAQTSGGKKGFGLLLALALALWGARNAATAIITALNIAYEEEEKRGFLKVTALALAMTVGAVIMALLAGAAIALLAALQHIVPNLGTFGVVLGKVLTYVLLGAVAAGAAATMFRYAPSRDKAKWVWLTPGSLFFAIIWIVLTLAFGYYVSNFGNYGATYGSLSAVVVLLTWLYLSSYVLLFGAELNSELEHQTAKDTTSGAEQGLGQRGAWSADHVASADGEEDAGAHGEEGAGASAGKARPAREAPRQVHHQVPPRENGKDHPYVVARVANRAGSLAGLRKVGMVTATLSTFGLSLMRKRGSEGAGAALLVTAAGLSLLKRKD
ncbi:MAG: Ribonuclease BN [uncultured Sphingomonas sp.]|uniref:Ribonuclease BN n=1 Tax=uncultured Sphingomonas sp. TaxID=158754 RepID=A0A6J4T8P5_9SPHN|nr:MAG: Ribonuclease BN [uncultured Sphingomonas sp.]